MGGSKERINTNIVHEPDKVKVAQIEARKAVELKKMEGENIELRKKATIEIMETNARLEQLIITARVEGFTTIQEKLVEMTRELNILAEQRILMLETASGETLKKMNEHYYNFSKQINKDQNDFMKNELPIMIEQLEKIDKTSPAYEIYRTRLDEVSSNFIENQNKFIKQVGEQQNQMFIANDELRKNVTEHTNRIVENRVKQLSAAVEINTAKLLQNQLSNKQIEKNINLDNGN